MAVNTNSWKRFPIADRDQSFNADEAIKRIAEWAKGSVEKFNSAFLWRNPQAPANQKNSYRLPIADIINGRPTLIPHAVFTAAAILSGAHGGLVNVVNEEENLKLKGVVTDIYATLAQMYGDSRVKPPWLRGGNKEENVTASNCANPRDWGSVLVAAQDHPWDGAAAKARLWEWAEGDIRKYREGFLWWDRGAPSQKGSYRLPVADIIDGEFTVVPRAVNAVAAALGVSWTGLDIPDVDMDSVEAVVAAIQTHIQEVDFAESEQPETVTAAAPVAPPAEWFDNPNLQGPTPLAVTADGRVMGHLAAWNTCHASFANKCVIAPRSHTNYKYFLNGSVLTASGTTVRVGKITLGTGHANIRLGWIPASDHYDNTGTGVAVVAAGEDRFGIWVAGAVVPGTSEERIAELRRSPLSGDWRSVGGNLELVAALAVNTPGFPIVNMTASGELDVLCAAGIVLEDGTVFASEEPQPVPSPDNKALERLAHLTSYVDSITTNRRAQRLNALRTAMGDNDAVQ